MTLFLLHNVTALILLFFI